MELLKTFAFDGVRPYRMKRKSVEMVPMKVLKRKNKFQLITK